MLPANCGCVIITAADESWADTLTYCKHSAQQTVGLYPDGGSVAYVFEQPTIGQTNQFSMYATFWDEPKYFDIHDGLFCLPATDDEDVVEILNSASPATPVYDSAGRKVATRATFNTLPRGIYIIKGQKILK